MSEEPKDKPYVGKYVVYDRLDGGACFGLIVDEGVVNTQKGEREVFLLDKRIVRYARTGDLKRFRRFYPDAEFLGKSTPGALDNDGAFHSGRTFLEIRRVKGITTLRKEEINLETDVVDFEDLIGVVDEETLFLALLAGREQGVPYGRDAAEIGLCDMLTTGNFRDQVKEELERRLGRNVE